jgi:hypothetical protein
VPAGLDQRPRVPLRRRRADEAVPEPVGDSRVKEGLEIHGRWNCLQDVVSAEPKSTKRITRGGTGNTLPPLPIRMAAVRCKQAGVFGHSCHAARTPPPPFAQTLKTARSPGAKQSIAIPAILHQVHAQHLFGALAAHFWQRNQAPIHGPMPTMRFAGDPYPQPAAPNPSSAFRA